MLEQELAQVNNKVKTEIESETNLTIVNQEKWIVGGRLKSYCKIRWTTASESVNSVINLEQILIKIVANNGNLLTNDNIARIIQSQNFFLNLRILAFVLKPLRKAVLALEAKSATLADCFLSLAKLAAVLNKLPKSFNSHFHSHCVKIINERFNEFNNDKYITCFFLDPVSELFERRLNLKLTTLELMYKLITYWKSNSKTELNYYEVDQRKNVHLSDDKINICIVEAFKETDENDDDDLTPTHKSTGGKKILKDNCYVLIEPVWIENFINLSHDLIIKDIDVPKDLLDDFDENMNDDNRVSDDAGGDEDDNRDGKGYYNYDVDDLLSNTDEEEED
ncbi:hypothetical protein RhiirC2_799003 [Rhizophagus irregularis]|uniref:Uncharacterized protein n=1 Tax=Rhizophagus irregularis TaxID=588596 RepID=A0A2N1M5R7_9GLOM|nr:hypothetical protein RhiirC2_799003 [Rhizophagus irregularis]